MKFVSNIPNDDLLNIYKSSLEQLEKRMLLRILELGCDPDEFEYPADLDSIEDTLIENDVEGRHRVKIIRETMPMIEMIKTKIEALTA